MCRHEFAFDREDRFFNARWGDGGRGSGSEAGEGPFGGSVGGINGGGVGGFDVVFGDYVDSAFFCGGEVAEGVFGVGKAARETDGEERRVVVDYLGIGKGGEVRGIAWKTCQ